MSSVTQVEKKLQSIVNAAYKITNKKDERKFNNQIIQTYIWIKLWYKFKNFHSQL